MRAMQPSGRSALPVPPTREDILDFLIRSGVEEAEADRLEILPKAKLGVDDETLKCLVSCPSGGPGFMLVSGAGNPDLVARAVRNIHAVRARLPETIAGTVLAPVMAGNVAGLSCAVWPRHEPFLASSRLHFRFRALRYRGQLLDWVREVCAASLFEPVSQEERYRGFERPLSLLAADTGFSGEVRHKALAALERLRHGIWSPRHCIQHGDLWCGNILLPRPGDRGATHYVIDWAGASLAGYPVIDSMRLGLSLRSNPRRMRAHLKGLASVLGCEERDLLSYTLCAIGALGDNLEHFPPDRYRRMSLVVIDALESAI